MQSNMDSAQADASCALPEVQKPILEPRKTRRKRPVADRLWEKVDKSGGPDACWPYLDFRDSNGYGSFKLDGAGKRAHRIAWAITSGPIPDGMFVCHSCDNPPCCNPTHLWLGTSAENTRDRHQKGRDAKGPTHGTVTRPERNARGDRHGSRLHPERVVRGERSHNAKLTDEIVRDIRHMHASGVRIIRLSERYDVSPGTIDFVVRRKTWAHVA